MVWSMQHMTPSHGHLIYKWGHTVSAPYNLISLNIGKVPEYQQSQCSANILKTGKWDVLCNYGHIILTSNLEKGCGELSIILSFICYVEYLSLVIGPKAQKNQSNCLSQAWGLPWTNSCSNWNQFFRKASEVHSKILQWWRILPSPW